jgi:hypothetical protein
MSITDPSFIVALQSMVRQRSVAAELKDCGVIDPGVVHRAVKVAQKVLYDAPLDG